MPSSTWPASTSSSFIWRIERVSGSFLSRRSVSTSPARSPLSITATPRSPARRKTTLPSEPTPARREIASGWPSCSLPHRHVAHPLQNVRRDRGVFARRRVEPTDEHRPRDVVTLEQADALAQKLRRAVVRLALRIELALLVD